MPLMIIYERYDEELNRLLFEVTIAKSSVLTNIQPVLSPKKIKKKLFCNDGVMIFKYKSGKSENNMELKQLSQQQAYPGPLVSEHFFKSGGYSPSNMVLMNFYQFSILNLLWVNI